MPLWYVALVDGKPRTTVAAIASGSPEAHRLLWYKERAAAAGIKWRTMRSRLDSGLTLDEALALGPAHRPDRRALAEAAGCSMATIDYRLRKGLSADEAVALGGRRPNARKLAQQAGVSFRKMQQVLGALRESADVAQAAARLRMTEEALRELMERCGLTVHEAGREPVARPSPCHPLAGAGGTPPQEGRTPRLSSPKDPGEA